MSVSRLRRSLRAYSLLEVIAASALMAFALVPALSLLRDGMAWTRDLDAQEKLLLYGVNKLEEQTAIVAASWTKGTATGDHAGDGHADIRYVVTRSDDSIDGGITNRLMAVSVVTYQDQDGDNLLDASEPQLTMSTKIGKFATYETL